jgi:hypothetical protein
MQEWPVLSDWSVHRIVKDKRAVWEELSEHPCFFVRTDPIVLREAVAVYTCRTTNKNPEGVVSLDKFCSSDMSPLSECVAHRRFRIRLAIAAPG